MKNRILDWIRGRREPRDLVILCVVGEEMTLGDPDTGAIIGRLRPFDANHESPLLRSAGALLVSAAQDKDAEEDYGYKGGACLL